MTCLSNWLLKLVLYLILDPQVKDFVPCDSNTLRENYFFIFPNNNEPNSDPKYPKIVTLNVTYNCVSATFFHFFHA